jgi:hypothetical protein
MGTVLVHGAPVLGYRAGTRHVPKGPRNDVMVIELLKKQQYTRGIVIPSCSDTVWYGIRTLEAVPYHTGGWEQYGYSSREDHGEIQ